LLGGVAFGRDCALRAEVVGVLVDSDARGLGLDAALFLGEVFEFGLESAEVLFKIDDLYVLDIYCPPSLV
jgi:hypothetical protein